MDYRQNKKNNDDIKKKELNDLISTDGQIKRENIIEAENILFNNTYKNLKYDEYGFVDKNDNKKNENNSKEEKELSLLDMQKENTKLKEWLEITPYFENYMNKNKKKLKLKIRRGIPDSLRGEIWMKISGADKFKQGRENLYNELITKINKNELYQIPDEDIIIKDMNRTFPKNLMFMNKLGDGQRKLFRVLSCFSSYNKKIGYVQGMSFITAFFLSYLSEENAFWMLLNYMKNYGLQDLYYREFPGLKKNLFVLLKLMQKLLPDIYNILTKNEIYPTIYASSWYLTIFTNILSFENVLRIMDCFFYEGIKIIHRISLGILALNRDAILKSRVVSDVMGALKNMTEKINIEVLFKVSFGFSISKKQISKYEELYNDHKNGRKPGDEDIMNQLQ